MKIIMSYNQKWKKILDKIKLTGSKVNPIPSCADCGCKAILHTKIKINF